MNKSQNNNSSEKTLKSLLPQGAIAPTSGEIEPSEKTLKSVLPQGAIAPTLEIEPSEKRGESPLLGENFPSRSDVKTILMFNASSLSSYLR